jgi:hypothetical protein
VESDIQFLELADGVKDALIHFLHVIKTILGIFVVVELSKSTYQQRLFYFVRGAFIANNNLAYYILHSFHAE